MSATLKLLKYDIQNGFLSNMDKLGIIVLAVICSQIQSFIPLWSLVQLCMLYGTLGYTFSDFETLGINILPRTHKRSKWWLSKCIWQICFVAVAHTMVYFLLMIFMHLKGQTTELFFTSKCLNYILLSEEELMYGTWSVTALMICLSFGISVLLSLLQMTLSMVLSQRYAFAVAVAAVIVLDLYDPYWLPIPVLRDYLLYFDRYGMNPSAQMIFLAVLSILCVAVAWIGKKMFQKYDIVGKEKL